MLAADLLPPSITETEFDLAQAATEQFEEAARVLDLEPWIIQRLRLPEREVTVHLVLVRDDGRPAPITAFRVQHSTARGPSLGGVRFSPDAQLSELRALAMNVTWQCALLDIPFGGACGAVVLDAGRLSERELRKVSKDYTRALRGMVVPGTDIFMEDAGSNPHVLSWMLDEHAHAIGRLEPAAVAGKPAALFGLPEHVDAAAQGLFEILSAEFERRHRSLKGASVALQGFGKTASALAALLDQAGARLVAVADISGGIVREQGLAVPELLGWTKRHRILLGVTDADAVCNADVLAADCDVLILAAAAGQVTAQSALSVRAPLVIESVPAALTPGGLEVLENRGVVVVPAILAGAGSAAAAYLEWSRGSGHEGFLLDTVEQWITRKMRAAFDAAEQAAERYQTSLRRAATLLAVERTAAALRLR